jgi:NADH-quinone oxidoreductase subunit F
MTPGEVVALVKDSGLRGRGGAGFPTGMKWGFLPPDDGGQRYLVVNADESEPGTCKDIPLMLASPHILLEGVIVSAYAIGARTAFIYVRGEVLHVVRRLQAAVAEAYAAGYLGPDILGSGARTSAVRRRRCWTRWWGCAASPGCVHPSLRSRGCTHGRR